MRYSLIEIGVALIVLAATASASAHNRASLAGNVGIEIVSDNGSVFQGIPFQDFNDGRTRTVKRYLEAKKGENYGIVIRNNTPERIGLVIAVDGRNIISGRRSELKSREMMYVVNAYEHARYDGWRTTSDEVHRFYFTAPPDSYSVKTFGDTSAMGLIAVAVYREKQRPRPLLEQKMEPSAPAPSDQGAPRSKGKSLADESAGTGFGDTRYSPVRKVEFEPERIPAQKMLVKYEWRDTLCGKGILRCGLETGNRLWDENGYAPFPPDYRRSR
jgi:hypothetical protein